MFEKAKIFEIVREIKPEHRIEVDYSGEPLLVYELPDCEHCKIIAKITIALEYKEVW